MFSILFFLKRKKKEEEKNKIKEILEKVKNLRLSKDLDDSQKRHREVAYDIVALATKKSKKYLKTVLESKSNNKRIINAQEKIYDLCAECDDAFSGGDGFLFEYAEFFTEPDLYNGEDYKLALAALDTIINQSYACLT